MAQTPNKYTLTGKLQIVIEGTEGVIELGDIEIPIQLDFRRPSHAPGVRGGANSGAITMNISGGDGTQGLAAAINRQLSNARVTQGLR